MNSVWVLIAVATCLSAIHAAPSLPPLPVNPGGIGGLFRGPNLETIIRGPDGSQITSEQIGGAVQTESRLEPIIVPDQVAVPSVPIAPAALDAINIQGNIPLVSPSPIAVESEIGVGHIQQVAVSSSAPLTTSNTVAVEAPIEASIPIAVSAQEPHIIETELVDAPEIEPDQSSDLKGPSGTISVRGSSSIVSGPASTTISEPIRRIPIAPVPVLPTSPINSVAPAPISVAQWAPAPIPTLPVAPAQISSGSTISVPLETASVQLQLENAEAIAPSLILTPPQRAQPISSISTLTPLRLDLVAPSDTPLISLGGTSGAGIADAASGNNYASPQLPFISSTTAPHIILSTQRGAPLDQTIVSSTQSPIPVSSGADIDVSRINLRYGSINPTQQAIPSNLAQIDGQNIISSTIAPTLLPQNVPQSLIQDGLSSVPNNILNRPLLTTANELRAISNSNLPLNTAPSRNTLDSYNIALISNGEAGNVNLQEQAVLTNQVLSNSAGYTTIDSRNVISSSQPPLDVAGVNRRPWLNVEPTPSPLLPTNIGRNQVQNLGSIGSVLDTVLVQPTDPRNREVIEFGGKQLENVGNIVPVVHNPVLVTGDVRNIQQVPTASIRELSLRNDLDPTIYNRYGRDTKKEI